MLETGVPRGTRLGSRRASAAARAAIAACVVTAGSAVLVGCNQAASATTAIEVGTASIPQPAAGGVTDAYLVIQNNGAADRLISARTSDGGRVTFRAPVRGGSATMRTVPDIGIPAGATIRFVPNSFHLLITGAGPMRGGTEITLTLVFAHAGAIPVQAEITNPQTGGSGYFLN